MGYPSRYMEEFVAKSDLKGTDPAQEVLVEKNFSIYHRNYFCGIVVKNVAALCHCLKILPDQKKKILGNQCQCIFPLNEQTNKNAQWHANL